MRQTEALEAGILTPDQIEEMVQEEFSKISGTLDFTRPLMSMQAREAYFKEMLGLMREFCPGVGPGLWGEYQRMMCTAHIVTTFRVGYRGLAEDHLERYLSLEREMQGIE